jgi:hypothetical protein
MSRHPLGNRAMTGAERQAKYMAKLLQKRKLDAPTRKRIQELEMDVSIFKNLNESQKNEIEKLEKRLVAQGVTGSDVPLCSAGFTAIAVELQKRARDPKRMRSQVTESQSPAWRKSIIAAINEYTAAILAMPFDKAKHDEEERSNREVRRRLTGSR